MCRVTCCETLRERKVDQPDAALGLAYHVVTVDVPMDHQGREDMEIGQDCGKVLADLKYLADGKQPLVAGCPSSPGTERMAGERGQHQIGSAYIAPEIEQWNQIEVIQVRVQMRLVQRVLVNGVLLITTCVPIRSSSARWTTPCAPSPNHAST